MSLFFIIIITFLLVSFWLCGLSIAPWFPSKKKDFARINKLASLKAGQIFYELGCGDGRVCYYIAKKNPESQIIGIELSIPVYLWAKIRELFLNSNNMKIIFGNALKEDFSKADVIYVYALRKSINGKLKSKFENELKKGAKVLSYIFAFDNWNGKTTIDKPNNKTSTINIYEV